MKPSTGTLADRPGAARRTRPSALAASRVWLYAILAGAWAFDFQSAGAGQGLAVQAVMLAVYLGAFALMLVWDKPSPIRIGWLTPLMGCGALYLATGIAAGIVNGQQPYPLLRNAANVLVYLTAAYATARILLTSRPGQLRGLLGILCLVYLLSRPIIYEAMQGGIDFRTVRFQIIGTSAIAATGYLVLATMFRLRPIELASSLAVIVVVVASVTRAFLLVITGQALILFAEARRMVSPRLVMVAAIAVLALAAALTFDQGQVQRWEDRLGTSGRSGNLELRTWYTRTSEWQFMLDEWTSSSRNLMIGTGFASETRYFLGADYGARSESMTGFGHNQHISMLFNGGVLGGLPLLGLMWMLGWRAFQFLRMVARHPEARGDLTFLGAWGATIILGVLAGDLVSASFNVRGTALWYGIGTGLLLGVQACFDPRNAYGRASAGPGSPR